MPASSSCSRSSPGSWSFHRRWPTRSSPAPTILPAEPSYRGGARGSRRPVPESIAEWGLGKGESAVLALALALEATAVLDDRSARRCASALGVPVIGTFGVIIRAKKRGLIAAAQPVIRSVIDAGLYYDDQSIRTLLSSVGERWS